MAKAAGFKMTFAALEALCHPRLAILKKLMPKA